MEYNLNFWWYKDHKCSVWGTMLFKGPISLGLITICHNRPGRYSRMDNQYIFKLEPSALFGRSVPLGC